MESQVDVCIVSGFGRGQWMAAELAKTTALKVALVDVTESMGRWAPEDIEGPFGFFRSERITPLQLERLIEDDFPAVAENGFVIWLKNRPIELKGPTTRHNLDSLKLPQVLEEYLLSFDHEDKNRIASLQKKILDSEFHGAWMALIAHQLTSSRFLPGPHSLQQGRPLDLFHSYSLRQLTRPSYERSLEWVKASGVAVYAKAQVIDLGIEGKEVAGVEVRADRSGLLRAHQFVWLLSSEETQFSHSSLGYNLFSGRIIEPEWVWVRFRLRTQACRERDALPLASLIIEDLELAWTHENFMLLRKTFALDDFDLWMRIPAQRRFQKSYLEEMGQKAKNVLNSRLPRLSAEIVDYPQEYHYTYDELGPSRCSVYSRKAELLEPAPLDNMHFLGPEMWDRLDWEGQFFSQKKVVDKITQWWQGQQQTKEKAQ